jgi:hypothetical protein
MYREDDHFEFLIDTELIKYNLIINHYHFWKEYF